MKLENMLTETRNPNTMNLDRMTPLEIVKAMNAEDRKVPEAVEKYCRKLRSWFRL